MKKFDLEAAKAGAPVCTRDGRNARIICFDAKIPKYPIVALITNSAGIEESKTFGANGLFCTEDIDMDDLVMVTTKREGWMNIYPTDEYTNNNAIATSGLIYDSLESAEAQRRGYDNCIATIKVEWEE